MVCTGAADAVSAIPPPMTDAELLRVAEHLAQHARQGQRLTLSPALCGRLADALLAAIERHS